MLVSQPQPVRGYGQQAKALVEAVSNRDKATEHMG
jgi:hypothetical protein